MIIKIYACIFFLLQLFCVLHDYINDELEFKTFVFHSLLLPFYIRIFEVA